MVFVVDGHNVIGQMPDLELSDPQDEERLIERLRRYQARTGRKIVVYFDPGGAFHLSAKYAVGAIEVVRAGTGTSADELIVQRVRGFGRPEELTIVTSDRGIRDQVIQLGAVVMDAAAFLEDMARGPRRRPRRKKRPAATSTHATTPLAENEVREWLRLFGQTERDEITP